MQLNTDAQRSTGAPAERGAGALGTCEMTKNADFTVTSVARIRAVHLCWKTAWACWEVLTHGAV